MTTEKDEKVKDAWVELDHSMLSGLPGLTHIVDEHEDRLAKINDRLETLEAHVIGLCNQAHSHTGTGEQPDDPLGVGRWALTENGLVCEIIGCRAGGDCQLRTPSGVTWYSRSCIARIDPTTCELMFGDEVCKTWDIPAHVLAVRAVDRSCYDHDVVWLWDRRKGCYRTLLREQCRLVRRDPKNIKEKERER